MSRVRCEKASSDIFGIVVDDNDGDKEAIEDIEKRRWRMIYGYPGSPELNSVSSPLEVHEKQAK